MIVLIYCVLTQLEHSIDRTAPLIQHNSFHNCPNNTEYWNRLNNGKNPLEGVQLRVIVFICRNDHADGNIKANTCLFNIRHPTESTYCDSTVQTSIYPTALKKLRKKCRIDDIKM